MPRIQPGQRFGKWTTIETFRRKQPGGGVETKWKVLCDCGTEGSANSTDLNKGKTKQCRKCSGTMTKDLSSMVFGKWKVIGKGTRKNGKIHWICRCECGKSFLVKKGNTTDFYCSLVHRVWHKKGRLVFDKKEQKQMNWP